MTVENTFGRWKGRFRRFLKQVDMSVDGVIKVVAAFTRPSAEVGADIRDTLAAYFLTPEGQITGN